MRQQANIRHQSNSVYSELVCVIPGQGLTTLFRCTTYAQALAHRSNNALREFKGKKVCLVERRSDNTLPTGWIYQEQAKAKGVARTW